MDISLQKLAITFKEGQEITIDRLAKTLHDEGELIIQHIGMSQQEQKVKQERERDMLLQEKFLESLVYPEIFSREDSVSPAHKKTFRWIFDRSGTKVRPWDNFVEWLETGSSTYWINGKAGSGKSTLMRFIYHHPCTIEALNTWAAGKELLMPAFFFWAAGTKLQQSVEGFLRSIIVQLLDKHHHLIPRLSQLETRLQNFNGAIYAWTEEKLLKCLEILVGELACESRICLFVDGLDEFNGDYEPLIRLIQEFVLNPHFKCCFSSRPENEFEADFKSSSLLKLQDLTRQDIWSYVEDRLGRNKSLQRPSTEEQRVWQNCIYTIVDKADGVFLWVQLVVSGLMIGLKNKDPPELLLKRLQSLPKTIEGLYSSMLGKIDDLYREEAAWYMHMALHCSNRRDTHEFGRSRSSICNYAIAKFGLTESLRISHGLTAENIVSKCSTVSSRIVTTCGGILEVRGNHGRLESDGTSESDQISQSNELSAAGQNKLWLSWESESTGNPSEGPNWSDVKVQFSHRTAKDFMEKTDVGQLFLRNCNSFPRYQALLDSATHVVYMDICRLQEKNEYMKNHAYWVMAYARKVAAEYEGNLHSLTALMDNLDDQIQSIFQQFEPTKRELHWCQKWIPKPSSMKVSCYHGRLPQDVNIYPAEGDPDDFLSLCACAHVYWYVEEKLKANVISPSKASQLALCCGFHKSIGYSSLQQHTERAEWYYEDGTDIRLLATLMHLQADPTVGTSISIWQAALGCIYRAKCAFVGFSRGTLSDEEYLSVIDAFLQAGADKDQKLILEVEIYEPEEPYWFVVEVNIHDLPLHAGKHDG